MLIAMGMPPLKPVRGCEEKLVDAERLLGEVLRAKGELGGCSVILVVCTEAKLRAVSRCAVFVP